MNYLEEFKKFYKEFYKRLKCERQKLFYDNIAKEHYIITEGYTDKFHWKIIGEGADCNYYKSIFINWLHTLSEESVLNFVVSIRYKNIGEIKWEDIIKVNTGNLTDMNYKDRLLKNHISKLKLE